jgi:hypothetical protein
MDFKFNSLQQQAPPLNSPHANAHPVRIAAMALAPGEYFTLLRKDWHWKTATPGAITSKLNRSTNRRFACNTLADKSGWIIIRTDNFGDSETVNYLAPTKQKRNRMIQKNQPERRYKFSDPRLTEITDEKIAYMRRDIDVLKDEGITGDRINALETKNNAFKLVASNVQTTQESADENEDVKNIAADCAIKCNRIRTAAENTFGTGSAKYRSFDFGAINTAPHPDRIHRYKLVTERAALYLSLMAAEGLTQAKIDDLAAATQQYDTEYTQFRVSQGNGMVSTEERNEDGNEIYDELAKMCNTAKNYWASRSAAKHDNYVIYDTPSGNNEAPPPVTT